MGQGRKTQSRSTKKAVEQNSVDQKTKDPNYVYQNDKMTKDQNSFLIHFWIGQETESIFYKHFNEMYLVY